MSTPSPIGSATGWGGELGQEARFRPSVTAAMNIRNPWAGLFRLAVAPLAAVTLTAAPAFAQANGEVHQNIVTWTSLGICLHARRNLSSQDASDMVYWLAAENFGLSRQQVDVHIEQPNFQKEAEGLITNAGGCERLIESLRRYLMK
jgi:hypothetical protein